MAGAIFGTPLKSTQVYSDSTSIYILVLLLFLLSISSGLIMHHFARGKKISEWLLQAIYMLVAYYLSLMLLKYGLDKVFKHQFYLPEPNLLYTPLGRLDKDILYWSSMGTSRFYNIFTGSVEILAAVFLLFRRTRMAGAFLALAIMAQVLMINLGFDISVKLYSAFLLFCAAFVLYPYSGRLVSFFFKKNQIIPEASSPVLIRHPFAAVFLKCMIIGFILFESLFPYLRSGNYNDDAAARPAMHGTYEVKQFISGNDTLQGLRSPVKRFFIHRNGYLIFQDQQDTMQDYKLDYDTDQYKYIITDYQQHKITLDIQYSAADSLLIIRYVKKDTPVQITGKGLDWRRLPLMKKLFHWTVD